MLRAVLFDLGDTLIDFEPMDTRAVFREAAVTTYAFLRGQPQVGTLPGFEEYSRRQFRSVRWAYLWAKLRRREFNSLALLDRFCRGIGVELGREALLELAWLWYAPLTSRCSVEDGLAGTLDALRRSGLKLGIVSNTFIAPEIHDRHLGDLGILQFFPVRVYSSEVGYRKPDARIYRVALDRLSVSAEQTLFVGDLVKTDVVGARRLGMTTVLKQPWGTARRHRMADVVIPRLGELPDVIRGMQRETARVIERVEVAQFPVTSV